MREVDQKMRAFTQDHSDLNSLDCGPGLYATKRPGVIKLEGGFVDPQKTYWGEYRVTECPKVGQWWGKAELTDSLVAKWATHWVFL